MESQEPQVELVGEAEANANEAQAIVEHTGVVTAIGVPTPDADADNEEDNGNEAIAVEEVQAGDAVAQTVAADQEA